MNDFENEIKLQTIGELKNSLEDYDLWLLDLDSQIDTEAIEHVLRIVHSLKGNSKAADFADLSEGCHVLEDYLVAYQSGLKVKNDHRQIFFLLEKFHTSFEINLQKVEVGESSFLKDDVEDLILTINNRSNLSLVDHQVQNNKLESNELLKVLLVDDDPELREIIDYIIKLNWKAEVVLAENGKIGLEMTREKEFDLIITDYKMPVMTGEQFVQQLRNGDSENRNRPIILLSGYRPNLKYENKSWVNTFLLEKPISPKKLDYYIRCSRRLKVAA